ncbi:MAG: UvrD-helicase domain-containing protein, partial [Clostridia bacterium]|nr:UvrD-helicase domain-containing protein [Clostridia bacterium]
MSETAEQLRAIKSRGKVLVSASAGAGKTTVMIKRLADIIEEGAELDGVLAVTFTKKAAVQMKDKLRRELISRLNTADEGVKEHLRTQLNKINVADVSTIHSFCARLIRTYFYVLKVDASFEVLTDGAESNELKARAMDAVFEELYSAEDEGFYLLLDRLRRKRSDRAVRELLLSAYDEVRVHPDYKNALLSACENTYTPQGFENVCGGLLENIAQKCSALASAVQEFMQNFHPVCNAQGYLKVLEEMRETLCSVASCGSLFGLPNRLANSVKPRVKAEVAEDDAAFSAFCDGVKKKYKTVIKDISDEESERLKFFESGKTAKAFCDVLLRFDEAYSGVKREEGKLDYGDLEHFALSLLKGEDCDNDVRDGIRNKYKYVFVDEYQDVNPIQDEIITAVAGGDLFCVGDLKQAIYGFRGSNSRFFADKCGAGGCEYIVLPDNFRSSRAVIDFVNTVFSRVMSAPVCEVDYGSGHAMRGGARYKEGCAGEAEICLFEKDETQKAEPDGVYSVSAAKLNAREYSAEGLAVLNLVEEALKGEYYDPDDGKMKKVQTGDICVLTRKRANPAARGIVRALTAKYPVA